MRTARVTSVVAFVLLMVSGSVLAQSAYYPPPGDWERRTPEEVGMDSSALAAAIEFAESQETSKPMDFSDQETIFGRLLGPIPDERAHTNGLVIRHGYLVAEFGNTTRVDPTYSAAKSYLSTLAGLAVDRGLSPRCPRPGARIYRRWRIRLVAERDGDLASSPSTDDRVGRRALGQETRLRWHRGLW